MQLTRPTFMAALKDSARMLPKHWSANRRLTASAAMQSMAVDGPYSLFRSDF